MAENPILIDEEEDKEKSPPLCPTPTTPLCERPTRSPILTENQPLGQKRGTFSIICSLFV